MDQWVDEAKRRVLMWRRDIHQHPGFGNRDFRTAGLVADHLRSLSMEVRAGIARTGVVGLLRGGLPGPVVGLRADMDAVPVTELVDVPFASRVRTPGTPPRTTLPTIFSMKERSLWESGRCLTWWWTI